MKERGTTNWGKKIEGDFYGEEQTILGAIENFYASFMCDDQAMGEMMKSLVDSERVFGVENAKLYEKVMIEEVWNTIFSMNKGRVGECHS